MEKIRIASFLAQCSLASRRKCEVLISEGKIKVNGAVTRELYFRIDPHSDTVEYLGKKLIINNKIVIALNKPPGFLCTLKDDFSRPTVVDLLKGFKEALLAYCDFIVTFQNHAGDAKSNKKEVCKKESGEREGKETRHGPL